MLLARKTFIHPEFSVFLPDCPHDETKAFHQEFDGTIWADRGQFAFPRPGENALEVARLQMLARPLLAQRKAVYG